jgi:hypothetical protein
MPARWWRVFKVVVDGIDRAEVGLQGLSTDGARLEEEAQVGENRLRGSRQSAHAWRPCIILHLSGKSFELDPFLVIEDLTVDGLLPPCNNLTPASKPGADQEIERSMKLAGNADYSMYSTFLPSSCDLGLPFDWIH